jgi:hypothetical protein
MPFLLALVIGVPCVLLAFHAWGRLNYGEEWNVVLGRVAVFGGRPSASAKSACRVAAEQGPNG